MMIMITMIIVSVKKGRVIQVIISIAIMTVITIKMIMMRVI